MSKVPIRSLVICLLGMMTLGVDADIIGGASSDRQPAGDSFQSESANTNLLLIARQALHRNEFGNCRRILQQALTQDRNLAHPDVLIAQWLIESGQQDKAMVVMERLAVTDPERGDVRLLFAQIALQQGRLFDAWLHATAAEKAPFPEEWSDDFRTRFRRYTLRTKAVTATRRAETSVAKSLYQQLIQEYAQPDDYVGLARIELALGNEEAAEKSVRIGCALPSVESIPELVMATIYDQAQKTQQCEQWYRRGLELSPESANAVRLRFARWLIHNNRADNAKRVIEAAEAPAGRESEYDFVAGLAERMLGNTDAAGKIFNRLHVNAPGDQSMSNQLALVMIETEIEENRQIARKIAIANARFKPDSAGLLATLGWVQFRLGELEKAENSLNLAIRQGEQSRDTLYYMAQVKAALGKEQEAELLRKAYETNHGEFFNKRKLQP